MAEAAPNKTQVQIGLSRIYLKDLSFESPRVPQLFTRNWQPEVKLQVTVKPRKIQDKHWEVALLLNVEAREGDAVAFMVEIEHAALFEITGAGSEQLENILAVFCPNTLFPYTRQLLDQVLIQGGFPPLMLAPINFEQLRRQNTPQATPS